MENTNLISNLLGERSNFILIGLTGRTGSGCTTTANLLSDELQSPTVNEVNYNNQTYFTGMDTKRYEIVRKYAVENNEPFKIIKISELISAQILNLEVDDFKNFIKSVINKDLHQKLDAVLKKSEFTKSQKAFKNLSKECDFFVHGTSTLDHDLKDLDISKWFGVIKTFTLKLKEVLKSDLANSYVPIYQGVGDSIRRTTKIIPNYREQPFEPQGLFSLPRMVNRLVKFYRYKDKKDNKKTYIAVDTIRNPYEAKYFKDRYAAFYLVSINAPTDDRKKYLQDKYKFTVDQINEIDKHESGKFPDDKNEYKCGACEQEIKAKSAYDKYDELIISNVKKCIEISDIHIFNPRNEAQNHNVLKSQLAWYLSLIKHPGLVTPTPQERVMQIAFTAKMNSGCISRQVGAVVTDVHYSIKSVGWNDVAKGQVPCNLRSLEDLENFSSDTTYSKYERNNEKFRKQAATELIKIKDLGKKGRNLAYCFKSIQNTIDNEKNQVHTRSLHAEENAFLQLAKYGGVGIEGGKLFTTASPCELCAKKAYQLGIKEIVYIDPYPGLAIEHIISIGVNPPKLIQFRGAVGKAYHQLYEPLMPYKDELDYLSS
ncbi:anti-phage dCTP deaminase [Cognaticolwellia mytili]|uniref:anti-phage dCTP deaminase n=1 Tax=Cognaticolwellia mytili TaxID=1888913 RepID=UPI000A175A25|nr:anti-phage dCTP deaminase [Cognaticolwellia mytili]